MFFVSFQTSSTQWKNVADKEWLETSKIVALIEWVPKLEKIVLPTVLRQKLLANNSLPLREEDLLGLDEDELIVLAQITDVIIFDYLTGNYDRIASMMVSENDLFFLKNEELEE